MKTEVEKYLSEAFDVIIPANISEEQLEIFLAEKINHLIINDFSSLVNILYRIDVSEQKIKTLLRENTNANAGRILAKLIIERQLQKLRSRQQDRDNKNNIAEDESW